MEQLINRALPLIFAVFGHNNDGEGKRVMRVGGSGIFIAPFLAITARHVIRDLRRLDSREVRPSFKGYFRSNYTADLFQVLDRSPNPRHAIWEVNRTWDPSVTDISLMQVSAESGAAHAMQVEMPTKFFTWSLLPPPIDSDVVMLGYPTTAMESIDGMMHTSCKISLQSGRVKEIYEHRRDDGMINFPSFLIDAPVDHGFSGGPVFLDDKLCGLVSAGSLDEQTYAASLWPLCLMEYEYPDQGILGAKRKFGDLFDIDMIPSADWNGVKSRISKRIDDREEPFAHISDGLS